MAIDLETENRALRARIDELEEAERQRIARVKVVEVMLPAEWHLTGAQRIALLTLLESPNYSATRDQLRNAFHKHGLRTRDVDNLICTLRRALQPVRVQILTVWGSGYRLSNEGAETIKSAIERMAGNEIQRIKLATATFVREPISQT